MESINIDPAHASTTIQVVMDILGVTITCAISGLLLDSEFGDRFMNWFGITDIESIVKT
jgi:hypothetical protein